MRIAVLGTGNIGGTLGTAWERAGHDVAYGSRSRPVAQAVDGADVVLLALPGPAVAGVVDGLGAALAGKVVIDATNRMGAESMNSRTAITQAAPGALYVRAFNSLGWENFADPPEGADLFFAADPAAEGTASTLIADVGLRPVLLGDASATGVVDSVAGLWFALVQRSGNRHQALRVVEVGAG